MKKKSLTIILSVIIFTTPIQAFSNVFGVSGKIVRTATSASYYGGCIIELDVPIGGDCTSTWVSLDCTNTYLPTGTGSRAYATALLASTLGKSVSIQIDTNYKHGSTTSSAQVCVAQRLDMIL